MPDLPPKEKTPNTTYPSNEVLSKESLDALEKFGTVLKRIYTRLHKEGYRMVDGKLIKTNRHEDKKASNSRR